MNMMKKGLNNYFKIVKNVTVIMLFFVALDSCICKKQNNDTEIPYIQKEVVVYEVIDDLSILDSLICFSNSREDIKNKPLGYIVEVTDESPNNISVSVVDYHYLTHQVPDAKFYYHGYKCAYNGPLISNLFRQLRIGSDYFLNWDEINKYYEERGSGITFLDDEYSKWEYLYIDGVFHNLNKQNKVLN